MGILDRIKKDPIESANNADDIASPSAMTRSERITIDMGSHMHFAHESRPIILIFNLTPPFLSTWFTNFKSWHITILFGSGGRLYHLPTR